MAKCEHVRIKVTSYMHWSILFHGPLYRQANRLAVFATAKTSKPNKTPALSTETNTKYVWYFYYKCFWYHSNNPITLYPSSAKVIWILIFLESNVIFIIRWDNSFPYRSCWYSCVLYFVLSERHQNVHWMFPTIQFLIYSKYFSVLFCRRQLSTYFNNVSVILC